MAPACGSRFRCDFLERGLESGVSSECVRFLRLRAAEGDDGGVFSTTLTSSLAAAPVPRLLLRDLDRLPLSCLALPLEGCKEGGRHHI